MDGIAVPICEPGHVKAVFRFKGRIPLLANAVFASLLMKRAEFKQSILY